MPVQPIPAIRFIAGLIPWRINYPLSLGSTGGQNQDIFTGSLNQSVKLTTWGMFFTAGTLAASSQVALSVKKSGTNYNISAYAAPAVSVPVNWSGEAWIESGDLIQFWCNVATATLVGSLWLQGVKYVTGEGALG